MPAPVHARQQIVNAVVALLTPAATGATVTAGQAYPIPAKQKTNLLVYTRSESISYEKQVMGKPRTLERTVLLVVEVVTKDLEESDAALDARALEVETALGADVHLGNRVIDFALASTESTTRVEGEQPVRASLLTYEVHYRTLEGAPGTILPP